MKPPSIALALCFALATGSLFGQAVLVTPNAYHPTVSPDGQWLAFTPSSPGIGKCRTDGSEVTMLLDGAGREPDWSWARNLIVYRDSGKLHIMNPSDGSHSVFFSGGFDDGDVWSPDGNAIAVQNSSPDGLRVIDYPGGTYHDVACDAPGGDNCDGEAPTWSPDNQWIAFEDGMEILKVTSGGGLAQIVVADLRDVSSPAWSPDGRWIAFAMDSGYYAPNPEEPWNTFSITHIWIADARGMAHGLRQVTHGLVNDGSPAWSPGSDTIFFKRGIEYDYAIWKTPLGDCCQGTTGNVDGDPQDVVDISDLSAVVDYLFFSGAISECIDENDVDISGALDISDLQALIDFLFFGATLPNCP